MKRLIPVIEEGGSVTEVLREPERTWLRQTLAEERKVFDEIGDDEFIKTKDDVFVLRKYRYKIDEKRSTVVERNTNYVRIKLKRYQQRINRISKNV